MLSRCYRFSGKTDPAVLSNLLGVFQILFYKTKHETKSKMTVLLLFISHHLPSLVIVHWSSGKDKKVNRNTEQLACKYYKWLWSLIFYPKPFNSTWLKVVKFVVKPRVTHQTTHQTTQLTKYFIIFPVGTAGIILQAPSLYDLRPAIDEYLSEIEVAAKPLGLSDNLYI